jgi:HK97 family phage major capsid protein
MFFSKSSAFSVEITTLASSRSKICAPALNAPVAKIELTKDSLGRYILANPAALTGPTLWGLPVVANVFLKVVGVFSGDNHVGIFAIENLRTGIKCAGQEAFQGKFLTGAFNAGAQIFDREDANVVISTENADCYAAAAGAVKEP